MSTRHLLNITMGTVAILLAASVGLVFNSMGDHKTDQARIDVAVSQQSLVQDISYQVDALANAGNLVLVRQAREKLGSSILHFDQNLAAMLNGGFVTNKDGQEIELAGAESALAKKELSMVTDLWIQTGLPLADLAAGEFSIFSSAGQNAMAGLKDNAASLVNHLGETAKALEGEVVDRHTRRNLARWTALGLAAGFIGLGIFRFKPSAKTTGKAQKNAVPNNIMAPVANNSIPPSTPEIPLDNAPPTADRVWDRHPHKQYKSPVDFDNVSASVDQLSVDMNTIASSTDKMGMAIDSVGHAMQGMLFSLQQMAQDTGEGYKIVRGANNAATYTHSTASELAESALEMSRVVSRVTQLAMKTKQVAGQIEAEAVHTGTTGEAFTSVVAGEVKGLAQQTSQATAGIEQTVAEIMGTARQYEEAIGQILKNISGINKVSENLGEMMLAPPAAGVAGTPLPSAVPLPLAPQPVAAQPVVAQPVAQAVAPVAPVPVAPAPAQPVITAEPVVEPVVAAAAEAPAPEPEVAPKPDTWGQSDEATPPEPTSAEVAKETAAVIDEAATDSEPSGSTGNVFMLGGGPKKSKAKATPAAEVIEEPKEEIKEEPKAEEPAAAEKEDDGANIFMLNKPKGAPAAKKEEPVAAAPEPEPAAEPVAEEPAPVEDDDGGSNIFMLNKPGKAAAPKTEAPAVPETAPVAEEPKAEEPPPAEEKKDSGANVFMLNKPKATPEAAKADEPEAKEEPVTVPADDDEEKSGSGGNVFMLNKPK